MKETRNIKTDLVWFCSYLENYQTISLIECQAKKIKQLEEMLGKEKLKELPKVESTKGVFTWIG